MTSPLDRIFARVAYEDGCWQWRGCTSDGYGLISVDGKDRKPHRLVYEALVGPVPAGHVIDHLCRNRACCNPLHMEVVTDGENKRRGVSGANNALKTHCPQGHEYTEHNTITVLRADGDFRCRRCRACELARANARSR